jgi:hypothetical protein
VGRKLTLAFAAILVALFLAYELASFELGKGPPLNLQPPNILADGEVERRPEKPRYEELLEQPAILRESERK